jgi:NDP-sugar pyrophosphorylase family protein
MEILDSTRSGIPPESRETPALVLAGGLGVRLRAAYDSGPKALAPVAGRPFLYYLLRRLRNAGFRRAVLCLGYRSEQIASEFGDGSAVGLDLRYSVESEPLGTAGALALAAKTHAAGERFFAMNGDSLCDVDFGEMLQAHVRRGAEATIALVPTNAAGRFGAAQCDDTGEIAAFMEKGAAGEGLINGGVYIFEPTALAQLAYGCPVSLERDVLPRLAGNGLFGHRTNGYFIDIGLPDDLLRAQTELRDRFAGLAGESDVL